MLKQRNSFIGAAALAFSIFASASANAASDAQEIVDNASAAAYYQGKDGKAKVSMTITDSQGRTRSREFVIIRTDINDEDNGEQRFYVHFNRPADVNRTAFMVWKHVDSDDDRWLYLPALDLVKRIAASDERTSFVGSHFFYEDVSGRGTNEDSHVLLETNDTYYVLESTPKSSDGVEFVKYKNWIHKDSMIPVKTEYFNDAGEIYRTYTAVRVEIIDGFATVVEARMDDAQLGGFTTMTYSSVDYDVGLPQDIFTERYLRTPPREYLR